MSDNLKFIMFSSRPGKWCANGRFQTLVTTSLYAPELSGKYPPIDSLSTNIGSQRLKSFRPRLTSKFDENICFYGAAQIFQDNLDASLQYCTVNDPRPTMDFAALMGKELSKSKKPSSEDKKFQKRSEVEAERKAAYLAEQKALEEEREAKATAKRKLEEDTAAEAAAREEKRRRLAEESRRRREEEEWEQEKARRRRLGLPEREKPKSKEEQEEEAAAAAAGDIPDAELRDKLRELGHPVTLFAESHAARLRRYKKVTTVLTDGPIPTTLKLVEEKDMKVPDKIPSDKEGKEWLFRQLASYFTMVLSAYERAMNEEKRDTSASKMAYNSMVQARENMKPVSFSDLCISSQAVFS
jgi:uncharacterized membrane protein YkoI